MVIRPLKLENVLTKERVDKAIFEHCTMLPSSQRAHFFTGLAVVSPLLTRAIARHWEALALIEKDFQLLQWVDQVREVVRRLEAAAATAVGAPTLDANVTGSQYAFADAILERLYVTTRQLATSERSLLATSVYVSLSEAARYVFGWAMRGEGPLCPSPLVMEVATAMRFQPPRLQETKELDGSFAQALRPKAAAFPREEPAAKKAKEERKDAPSSRAPPKAAAARAQDDPDVVRNMPKATSNDVANAIAAGHKHHLLQLPLSDTLKFKDSARGCIYCGALHCPDKDIGTRHKNYAILPKVMHNVTVAQLVAGLMRK